MQSLTVRETRELVTRNIGRAVGEQIASAVRKIVAKAKKRTGLVEARRESRARFLDQHVEPYAETKGQ